MVWGNKQNHLTMDKDTGAQARWSNPLTGIYLRFAASGIIPARWYQRNLPGPDERAAATGVLDLEIVSHCWNYAHLLVYQLSSLVNFPPTGMRVTMTVFYAVEDRRTLALLEYFGKQDVPGVTWNWQVLQKEQLFRRSIGRNQAALASRAHWVWFTDCDLMFRENCLDVLAEELQGRPDVLVYPRQERVTDLLETGDPILDSEQSPRIVDIDADRFVISERGRATGPLQITHGDVARACGYCNALEYYQRPAEAFAKAYEDRAFRWLLRSDGVPLDLPGVYRIRHVEKGRYTGNPVSNSIRSRIRRLTG
jgi:hypothetical protein